MRILIAAVGSRGDVAPITGLGTALRGAGHDVTVATYGIFEDLVTSHRQSAPAKAISFT